MPYPTVAPAAPVGVVVVVVMISCFLRPKHKKQCMRTRSFVGSLFNKSAELLANAATFCKRKCTSRQNIMPCIPLSFKSSMDTPSVTSTTTNSTPVEPKKSHFRRVSEVDFSKTYKIGKTLGHGGFSIVKTGTNILTSEPVAIKIIDRSKYGPKDESLEREIQVLEKVQHPNCICFKECFFTTNSVYLITELVTGGELLDRVLAKGKYTEHEAARTIHQVLMGVAYLHSAGIVHRDLKLENILLKTPEDDAVVKIADFGLSKIFAGAAILSTICGSPQYVAPEVLEVGQKRSSYSPAADLWSVGVILYILLCGFSPFDDVSETALFKKIKKGQYSFQAPVWEIISDEAKDLVCGLLCVSPDRRLTAPVAIEHTWIQQHVNGSGLKLEGGEPQGADCNCNAAGATSELKLLASNANSAAAPSQLQSYPETSESSDDDDDESEDMLSSSRSSHVTQSSSASVKAEEPASPIQSDKDSRAQTSQESSNVAVIVRSSKPAEPEQKKPWRHVSALRHKMKSQKKGFGKSRKTRFNDMNF